MCGTLWERRSCDVLLAVGGGGGIIMNGRYCMVERRVRVVGFVWYLCVVLYAMYLSSGSFYNFPLHSRHINDKCLHWFLAVHGSFNAFALATHLPCTSRVPASHSGIAGYGAGGLVSQWDNTIKWTWVCTVTSWHPLYMLLGCKTTKQNKNTNLCVNHGVAFWIITWTDRKMNASVTHR